MGSELKTVQEQARVGVGVIIIKNSKVLFGHRVSPHGEGTWCPPGGKLDYRETFEQCAKRETLEEAGIKIKNCRIITATNDLFEDGQHFITVYMQADWQSGTPRVMEPDKVVDWQWVDWDKLPRPLFMPMNTLIKTGYKLGKI